MCSSSAGAAIAAARMLGRDFGGEIRVIGTPAEEAGNGKVHLIAAGVFDDVDACLQIHPSDSNSAEVLALAVTEIGVTFHGVLAHASADPWLGKNALDAIVLLHTMVAQWRQHLKPGERVHGIITHGGAAPNIVPDLTSRALVRPHAGRRGPRRHDRALRRHGQGGGRCHRLQRRAPQRSDEPLPHHAEQPDHARDLAPAPRRGGSKRRPDRSECREHGHGERQPRGADDPPVSPDRAARHARPLPRVRRPRRWCRRRRHAGRRRSTSWRPPRSTSSPIPPSSSAPGRSCASRAADTVQPVDAGSGGLSDILAGQPVDEDRGWRRSTTSSMTRSPRISPSTVGGRGGSATPACSTSAAAQGA